MGRHTRSVVVIGKGPTGRYRKPCGATNVSTLAGMSRSTHQALADERNASVEVYINGEFFPVSYTHLTLPTICSV